MAEFKRKQVSRNSPVNLKRFNNTVKRFMDKIDFIKEDMRTLRSNAVALAERVRELEEFADVDKNKK